MSAYKVVYIYVRCWILPSQSPIGLEDANNGEIASLHAGGGGMCNLYLAPIVY